jgi:hypothetical protein
MTKRGPRSVPVPRLTLLLGLLLLFGGCGPQELTWERAAAIIEEQHLPEPVTSFTYRISNDARYRRLEACEEAGLLSLRGERSNVRVGLTDLGREHIRSLETKRVAESLDYTIHFRSPIPARFIRITRIEPVGPNFARAGYVWKYECPPILEPCTTLTDQLLMGSATFVLYDERWRIHQGPIPEEQIPTDKKRNSTAP